MPAAPPLLGEFSSDPILSLFSPGGGVLQQYFNAEQMREMTPMLDPETPTGLNYYPLPGVGPFSLLKETEMNHWGKVMFRWMYWNILLPGKELPLPALMSMAGKDTKDL